MCEHNDSVLKRGRKALTPMLSISTYYKKQNLSASRSRFGIAPVQYQTGSLS